MYRSRKERVKDAHAESEKESQIARESKSAKAVEARSLKSEDRLRRISRPKHFAVCVDPTNEYVKDALIKSYRLMDLNILWVEDFDKDLPRRLGELSKHLQTMRRPIRH